MVCSGTFLLAAQDPRARELLTVMMANAGPYRIKWPVDQRAMNNELQRNATLSRGVRSLPFCHLAGTNCDDATLREVAGAPAPFVFHCMSGKRGSRRNMRRVLKHARQRLLATAARRDWARRFA